MKPFHKGSFSIVLSFLLCFVFCLLFIFPVEAQLPEGFIRERIATGLNPTSIVVAPDGRIFITEKNGVIRIIRDDVILEAPFLKVEVDDSNERGLGHMVLHPDFDQNGYYYVFYAVPGLRHNRISRFTANGDNTIPGSEMIILELDEGGEIHNGGDMVFGFDGYLYVASGDGGQNWNGEDLGSTNGKILRIDEFGNPHPENPWYNLNYRRANMVYAYGLRNPFTITLHPITGQIFANDVGGSRFEEVNVIEQGGFFGWPKVEGMRTNEVVPSEYKDPLFQYSHTNGYCAIVGATFYLPEVQQFPTHYLGRYFYSDYCTGNIRMLDPETGQDKGAFITDGDRVIDLDISSNGSLYYLERKGLGDGSPEDNTGTNEGTLWRVSFTGSGAPFISIQPSSVLHAVGEDASFHVVASGAVPLTYNWFINGEELNAVDGSSLTINSVTLDQDSSVIRVEIMNAFGLLSSEEVLLRVTSNHRPEPIISSPVPGGKYYAGQPIVFSGYAEDIEDGTIPATSISWKIDFHHGTHSHPALSWSSGVMSGEWIAPALGETSAEVWYRVYLKATDSEGFSKITYTDVFPQLGKINVASIPDGLVINLDGSPLNAPYEIEGVQGVSRFITSPYKQVKGDSVYFFNSWTDGSVLFNREIKASPESQTFTAKFDGIRNGKGIGLTAYYYDNSEFAGEPVAVAIDSLLDHQYLLRAPYAGVPEDNFGIVWKGYILPYKSGVYDFTVFADDGVFVEVNGNVIIQDWEAGVHHETGSIFLEQGRLYPIHIRLYEYLYGAQLRLRWSTPDFPEEVISTSQLYPDDFLSSPTVSEIISIEVLNTDDLNIRIESYKEMYLDVDIIAANGIVMDYPEIKVDIGLNTLNIDTHSLTAGVYYLRTKDLESGKVITTTFAKLQ
ncbi:MAG TPA: PQQ-dependent sugar dehydrogenase [Saprospiraceae bacterium]